MKKILLASAAVTVLGSAAVAADLPSRRAPPVPPVVAPAPYNWTGFYIGGFAGVARGSRSAVAGEPFTGATPYNGAFTPTAYGLGTSFIGGATVGYNWQAPLSPFVLGVEGEGGYLNLRGSRQDVNAVAAGFTYPDSVNSTRIGQAYGVVAGRVGYAFDRAMLYAKGGVAFVNNAYRFSDPCTTGGCGPFTLNLGHSAVQVTYAVGGGLAYAIDDNWSVKAEYLYLGTGKTYSQNGVGSNGFTYTVPNSVPGVHTGKIGLNYRFLSAPVPVVARY